MKFSAADYGPVYTPEATTIRLWAPTSEEVTLRIYQNSRAKEAVETYKMDRQDDENWIFTLRGDYQGRYYTLQSKVGGKLMEEAVDPYSPSVGYNGQKGMIAHMESTNPEGWDQDEKPELKNFTDAVIYELHVDDFSSSPNSGMKHKGKFLALTEEGTRSPEGDYTGLEHLKELGITHLHLLPVFDYDGVDEFSEENNNYNWGYNPRNYNALAGTYSTNPDEGHSRIKEFKEAILTLHNNGIRVVMDMVYNHTGRTEDSNLHQLVPGYYHRFNQDGSFSNGSGCGNELASERPMVRKMMIDSLIYWAREYNIDGFRFDLMGLHDIETMNLIREEMDKIDPTILLYGEGWTGGDSPLPFEQAAMKVNGPKLKGVALFSDDMRDGVKGHVFSHDARGFVSGQTGVEEVIKFGITASTLHPQVKYNKLQYSQAPWAHTPQQTINYASCHDNHTLWDRLAASLPGEPQEERIKMQKLANAIILTSQGIPFLHAGVEFCRTKEGVENSYNAPREINQLDWARKTYFKDVFLYHQGLIQIRKAHPAFRLGSTEEIQRHLVFLSPPHQGVVGFMLKKYAGGDTAKEVLVYFNGQPCEKQIYIPQGKWTILADRDKADPQGIGTLKEGKYNLPGRSALICITP